MHDVKAHEQEQLLKELNKETSAGAAFKGRGVCVAKMSMQFQARKLLEARAQLR